MAFILADLKCIDGSGTSRTFKYVTDDTTAATIASAYFDAAADPLVLRFGDTIMASTDQDGTPGKTVVAVTSANGVTPVTTAAI